MGPGKTRDDLEWEIRELQNALISTVRDERLRDLLWSYPGGDVAPYVWEHDVIKEVLVSTKPAKKFRGKRQALPFGGMAIYPDTVRAPCPLCGGGRESFAMDSPAAEGTFSLPEGLKRHLEGYGKMRQCPILKAAIAAARRRYEEQRSPREPR